MAVLNYATIRPEQPIILTKLSTLDTLLEFYLILPSEGRLIT